MNTLKSTVLLLSLSFVLSGCAARSTYVKNGAALRDAGAKRADSAALSPEERLALRARKVKVEARVAKAAATAALKKDNECAILHDSLQSIHDRDFSIRAFTAKFGEAETRAMAKRVQRNYEAKRCAAWLDERGGVGAAWRRVRVSQWTSFRSR